MLPRFLPPALLLAAAVAPAVAQAPPDATERKARHAGLVTATYQVADLVVPLDNPAGRAVLEPPAPVKSTGPQPLPDPEAGAVRRACVTTSAPVHTLEDRLIKLISSTVAPTSWEVVGGPGRIEYYPLGMTLVVTQTPDVQERVADLLAAVRRMQDVEVVLEVRLVSVAEGFCERVGVDFNTTVRREGEEPQPAPALKESAADPGKVLGLLGDRSIVFLDDRQLARFIDGVQGDQRTNILQAPKLTVCNAQTAALNVTEQHYFVTGVSATRVGEQVAYTPKNEAFPLGLRMCVQPVVSADRRSVCLNLKINQTELATGTIPLMPVTTPVKPAGGEDGGKGKPVAFTQFIQQPTFNTVAVDQTVTIPDGKTAVLNGGTQVVEVRSEFGPPVLSKMPYVSRLFKNTATGRETRQMLVLVTPRIIVSGQGEKGCVSGLTACPAPRAVPPAVVEQEHSAPAARRSPEQRLAATLKKYHEACAAGDLALAKKMALRALAIDPTCFSKQNAAAPHGPENQAGPTGR